MSLKVLKGRLIHIEYRVVYTNDGAFEVYESVLRYGEDSELHSTGQYVNIIPRHVEVLLAGQSYSFDAGHFHENYAPEPTVTIMSKHGMTLAQNPTGPRPRVLCQRNTQPDNSFSRYAYDEKMLQNIISDYLSFLV